MAVHRENGLEIGIHSCVGVLEADGMTRSQFDSCELVSLTVANGGTTSNDVGSWGMSHEMLVCMS